MEDFVNCETISVKESKCIRTTFSRSHCRDCEDICVVDAIVFSPSASVNKTLCIKCGLCYAACRFSAINIKKDNKELINFTKDAKTIDIGCIFSESDIKIACISRITEDLLINWFASQKEILIKRGNCKRCKFKDTLKYFNESFKKAALLAQALEIRPNIKIKTQKSSRVYIPRESFSRRDMFSPFKALPRKSIPKRKLLIQALTDRIKNETDYPDAAVMKITKQCTICGVCEYVCSQKAVLIEKKEDKGIIYFNSSLCIACRECEDACIYNALKIKTSTVSKLVSNPIKVFETQKKVCRICGKEFYSDEDKDICSTCRAKEEGKSNFLKFLKNI